MGWGRLIVAMPGAFGPFRVNIYSKYCLEKYRPSHTIWGFSLSGFIVQIIFAGFLIFLVIAVMS